MFASIFIIVVSALLFAYWFRYTCLLILSGQSNQEFAPRVASANELKFLDAQSELVKGGSTPLETLQALLDRDYRLITYLLNHATFLHTSGTSIEEKILMLDYRVMSFWYRITRPLSEAIARKALLEKASIVSHLANAMGERVAVGSRG